MNNQQHNSIQAIGTSGMVLVDLFVACPASSSAKGCVASDLGLMDRYGHDHRFMRTKPATTTGERMGWTLTEGLGLPLLRR